MIIVTFLCALALLYAIWCRTIHKGMKNLRCTRAFSKPAVFAGEEGELVEVVRNDSSVIIPALLLESRISRHLRLGRQENLLVSGDTHFCSQFTLMPYQQIQRRHHVRFLHRGSFNLGNASMTASDIFGFCKYRNTQNLDAPVLVYPPLLDDSELPVALSCHLREITQTPQLLQDPFLIRGLRHYQPGDPVRDIHWAATARTGEVQVRIHDYSARTQLLVVLNAQLHEKQWHDHLVDEDAETIEYGISMAATACVSALRQGLGVGFATNMVLDNEKESVMLMPTDGNGWEEKLLTTFARLKILRTKHFPQFLQELTVHSGLDILVLSAYNSDGIEAAIQELKHAGNQVFFQLVEGGNVCSKN